VGQSQGKEASGMLPGSLLAPGGDGCLTGWGSVKARGAVQLHHVRRLKVRQVIVRLHLSQ